MKASTAKRRGERWHFRKKKLRRGRRSNVSFNFQKTDGSTCVYKESSPVWCAGTADDERGGKGGETLVLSESDGNLAMYNIDSKLLWQSGVTASAP